MAGIKLELDGDECRPDLLTASNEGRLRNYMGNNTQLTFAVLPSGTSGGRPSVTIRIDAADGTVVLSETTWRLLHLAVLAIEARYGTPEGSDRVAVSRKALDDLFTLLYEQYDHGDGPSREQIDAAKAALLGQRQ